MNRSVRACMFALAAAFVLLSFPSCSRQGEQLKTAAETKPASTPAQTKDVWVSQTTGKEYHVTVAGDTFRAEWVNISPDLSAHGTYMRTECKKHGEKWIGKTASYLPCSVTDTANSKIENWCHLETAIEIFSMTPDRITGNGGTLKKFDCMKCQIIEQGSKDFFWTPKK